MKLTVKGQVTIPKRLRMQYGLTPEQELVIEEAPGGVLIRAAGPTRAERVQKAASKARGIADSGLTTEEIIRKTREG